MRILHLSDLHIGIKLYNHDLHKDQEYLFEQITDYVREYQPDAVLIAGDIYDKAAPSVESVQLFNHFMEALYEASDTAQIMIISGNHDSAQRLDYFSWLLSHQRVHMVGIAPCKPDEYIKKVVLTDAYGPVNFYLLPFCKPSVLKGALKDEETTNYNEALHRLFARETIDNRERNILVSHQFYLPLGKDANDIERMESEITAVGNIDVVGSDLLEPFEYAALGHIHKPMSAGDSRFRYSGTPMAYSVSEAGQEKGILMVDIGNKGEPVTVTKLLLMPKHQVRIIEDTFETVLRQASEDYVQINLTDMQDLDVIDLQERLFLAFPNLLEIRRMYVRGANFSNAVCNDVFDSPYELICSFIPDMDTEEQEIIQSVINEALEVDA